MTRAISSPIQELQPHYEVVVVGSGYGGGISASRLARAGRKVCLLERGREIRPGQYPDTPEEAPRQMQVHVPVSEEASRHIGPNTGMFDFHVSKDINVLVGCGLGGTSLINANVSIRPDGRVLTAKEWPREIREHPTDLDRYYGRAEYVLRPAVYPESRPPLDKLLAHEKATPAVDGQGGRTFRKTAINVTFEDVLSPAGVEQKICNNCGNCVSGCNNLAKNTTLMNYLPDAHNHGASIFCQCSVDWVEKGLDGRWVIHFHQTGDRAAEVDPYRLSVTADILVLSAGTLGTTGILLRSRERGLALSSRLGQRFTGNGDILGFAYDCEDTIHGIGWLAPGREHRHRDIGPCITSVIDMRGAENVEEGYILEEGSIPGATSVLTAAAFAVAAETIGKETKPDTLLSDLKDLGRSVRSLFTRGQEGATDHTQTYLIMGNDDGNGVMGLAGEDIRITSGRGPGCSRMSSSGIRRFGGPSGPLAAPSYRAPCGQTSSSTTSSPFTPSAGPVWPTM